MQNLIKSFKQTEDLAEHNSTTGIVLLTPARRVLYMNRQARELCQRLVVTERGEAVNGLLPQALYNLRDEVLKQLDRASHIKDWESVEFSRMAGDPERPVVLRGLMLPGPIGVSSVCVLILMQESGNRPEALPTQAKERFQLTAREEAAIRYLSKGCTNKEIADALGISEPTVKEHLRNIMQKTGTRTRTGILARILAL